MVGGKRPAIPADALLQGERFANRFVVRSMAGRGGMGEVYEVEDLAQRGRIVALKILRADGSDEEKRLALARLRREHLVGIRVEHPGVCRTFESGVHEGHLFVTMEFLEGETLANRLTREGRLKGQEAVRVAIQLAEALAAAHDAGVLHRDLKSANVMLVPRNGTEAAVITDLGLACLADPKEAGELGLTGITTTASIVAGTPAYMAPEQLTGDTTATRASDIYSLGVVLYQLVTGELPFRGRNPAGQFKLQQRPPAPSGVVPGLESRWDMVISGCLNPDPLKRFRNALEIPAVLGGQRGPRRRSALVAGILCVSTALVALWTWRSSVDPQSASKETNLAGTVAARDAANPVTGGAPADPTPFLAGLGRIQVRNPSFSEGTGVRVEGNAAFADGRLRLTDGREDRVGMAWYRERVLVRDGVSIVFQFQIRELVSVPGEGAGGDGMALFLQGQSDLPLRSLGKGGGGLGYSTMPDSLVLEFDTYRNFEYSDPNDNHLSIQSNGTDPNSSDHGAHSLGTTTRVPNLKAGAVHTVLVRYVPDLMRVYVDDRERPVLTSRVNLMTLLKPDQGKVWVGFTASTGRAAERTEILNLYVAYPK